MQSSGSPKKGLDSFFFNYILPFLVKGYPISEKRIKKGPVKQVSSLEKIISKIDDKDIDIKRKVNDKKFDGLIEKNILDIIKDEGLEGNLIDYSLELVKEVVESNYDIVIDYEENKEEEKLKIKIKPKGYLKNNFNDKDYNFSIVKKKEKPENKDYSLKIKYEYDNKERLSINYSGIPDDYKSRRSVDMHDFSGRVPGKHVNVFPESLLGGILGFTYLGENFMGKREDMIGDKMVDIHESIHTEWEYETRVLTSWIMSKELPKYIK